MKQFYQSSIKAVLILFFSVSFSTIVSAQIPNCATPVSPTNGATLTRMATFTWTAPVGGGAPTGYKIFIGTTSAANEILNPTVANNSTATTFNYRFQTNVGGLLPGVTYYWKVVATNASGDATGCSVQTFTISAAGDPTVFPVNTWNAYCYNSNSFTNYVGYYTETPSANGGFDSRTSWTSNDQAPSNTVAAGGAASYLGGAMSYDNHSVSYKRQGFTPGYYTVDVLFDDNCWVYLNGTLVYNRNGYTTTYLTAVTTVYLDASSQFEFRWSEGGGGSNGSVKFNSIATLPTLVAGSISGDQFLCSGGSTDPAAFTSTAAASGACGTITYQWQSDVNCTGTFTNISGATNATYDAPAGVTQTTCYRRLAVDYNCNRNLASNTVTVTVGTTPGNPAVFPVNSWNGYVYGFTSYSSADAGWTDYRGYFSYTNPSDPSFNTSTIYTTANVPSSAPGYLGCVATANLSGVQMKRQGFTAGTYSLDFSSDDAGYLYVNGVLVYSRTTAGTATSVWTGNLDASSTVELRYKNNTATALGALTFNLITPPALVAGTIAGNQSLCLGVSTDPAAFTSTAAASGACGTITYQWQSDVNCTGTFTDISGATLATYDAPAGVTQTTCYRRMAVDANCSRNVASNTITVTVYPTAPGDPTVFPVNSWNGYVYGFASYSSADAGWADYRGYFSYTNPSDPSFNTSTIYTTANVPSSAPGYLGCAVTANLSGVQMKRQGFTAGTYSLDFSSDDAGYLYVNGVLVYSRATNGSATAVWTGNLDATSTIELRYKNNTAAALGALTFNLIPTPTLNPGVIAGNQILCPGNDPYPFTVTTPVSGACSAVVSYKWQQDVGCTGSWTDIAGATLTTYDVPAGITQTTCYRRVVTDANCGRSDYSNTLTVTVTTVPQGDPTVFPLNSWNAYVYDFSVTGYTTADNNWTDYKGYFPINTVSFNTTSYYASNVVPSAAPGYTGCQLATYPLTGAQIKRQGFPTGTYQIDFTSDDAGFLYINGVLVYSRTGNGTATNVWTGNLDASSTIDYRYKNNGGNGSGALTFTIVTPTIPLTEGGIALNGPSTICPTNSVTPIVSTLDASSSCYLYYQWQVDSTGTGYIDVIGATTNAYTPASLSTSASFRRKVTDACGDVAYSNSVNITVGPSTPPDPSVFGTNSWIAYVYNQQNYVPASLFGSYTDPGVSSTDPSFNSNNSWNNLSSPSMAATYTGCQAGVDNHSVIYKRQGFPAGTYTLNVLNDDACLLYIDGVLVYSRNAYTPTFINGVWTGVLGAATQIEFRWTEGGGNSNGAVTFILQSTPGPLLGGTISNATTQVCSGDVPTAFTSTALPSNGCSVAAYQWQMDNGSGYTDITGATSVTYSLVAQTVSTSYRRKVTDACSQVAYSNVFVINVASPALPDPSVFGTNKWNVYAYNDVNFTQLRGSYVDNGFSASDPSFDSRNKWGTNSSPSSAAGYTGCSVVLDQHGVIYKRKGFPSGKYQLDYNSDDAGSVYVNGVLVYTSVSWGTLVTNIWTGNLNSTSTIEYRWADTGGGASYGQLAMIHPVTTTALVAGTIANSSTTVCSGDAPAPFTSTADASGGCYKTYQWQLSTTSSGSGYTDISGATATTYTPAAITVKTYYRRKVTDACGATVYSNVITINVGVPSPPTITWGNGQWNAYVYNGRNFTTLYGSYIEPNTSSVNYSFDTRNSWPTANRPSLASTYSGCQVGDNTFSVSYRQTNFTTGTYQIDLEADDDAVLIIDGVTKYTGTGICCTPRINVWTGTLTATSQVEIRYGENNGNAYCKATITSSTPPSLLPGTIGSDQLICSNVVPAVLTSVTDATSGCALTYQWQRSTTSSTGPWTNVGGNTSSYTPTPPGQTVTTYYIRTVTDACGRTASSNVITVTINPKPGNAGTMTGLSNVCSGQAGVTYSIAAVANATSYTWSIPADATITSGDGTNSIVVTFGSISDDITVQPTNACGTGLTSTISVTVAPSIPIAAGVISGPTTVCQAQFGVLYSIAAVPNAASYIWTLPTGSTFISGATTTSPQITFGAVGGTISVTPTNGCGNALTASNLTVAMTPTPGAAGNITGTGTVCPGQTGVAFSIAAVANTTTYNWSLPAGAVITSGAGTRSIVVTFGSTSGNVTVTPTNSCGTGTAKSMIVSVITLGSIGSISGLNPVCQNTTNVTYTIPVVTGASTYTWTVPSDATIVSGNGTRTIRVNIGTTSGNITVTPSNTCQTGTAAVMALNVTNSVPSPAGAITGNNNPCRAEAGVPYSIAAVSGATKYIWAVPTGATIVTGANTNAITVDYGGFPGNVVVTPNNVCGNGTNFVLPITLKPFPSAVGAITGATTVCKSTGINYTYSISSVANALNYSWSVPAGATVVSGAGTTSIVVSYAGASVSSGSVTVVASNTCSSTSNSITVAINNCPNTWTGSLTTDWNTAGNWSANAVPTSIDDVVIPQVPNKPVIASGATGNANSVTINSSSSLTVSSTAIFNAYGSIVMNSNSVLTISSAAIVNAYGSIAINSSSSLTINSTGTLNAYGSITNNGSFTANSGSTVALLGTTAQTLTGITTLYNAKVNNNAGVTIASGASNAITLKGKLSLTAGALTTNGNLTVDIDHGGNIGYASGDAGSVSGNVTVFRAIVSNTTHYISCPLDGVTANDLADDAEVINPATNKTRLFQYNTSTFTWTPINNLSTVMPPNTAFSMWFPSATSVDFTGTYNHAASYTYSSPNIAAKFMFVSNPYPSTLDWEASSGWTKTGIKNAIYFWNPTTNSYASYVSGQGTNSANQYIPAMNSFFVAYDGNAAVPTATVAMTNSVRTSTYQSMWRTASDETVRLTLKSLNASDEAVIRFNQDATNDFDDELDAYKFLNSGSVPSIYTTFGATKYSINSIANPSVRDTIPVFTKIPADGDYILRIVCSDPTLEYILVDKKLGTQTLVKTADYSYTALKADSINRFDLLRQSTTTGVQQASAMSDMQILSSPNGFLVKSNLVGEGTVEILDATGNRVKVLTNVSLTGGNNFFTPAIPDGLYVIKVTVGNITYAGQVSVVK